MQKPSICRMVVLTPNGSSSFSHVYDSNKQVAAVVTDVHENGTISATAFPPGKEPIPIYEVRSEADAVDGQPYWLWPVIEKPEVRVPIAPAAEKEEKTPDPSPNGQAGKKSTKKKEEKK